jgi:hypothetical protein
VTEAPSIFISHAHEDKPLARPLTDALSGRGYRVWLDEAELRIGDSLVDKISSAIAEGDFVVAIVSPSSLESKWCQQELSWAASKGIANKQVVVLPIRYRGAQMPSGLTDKVWANADEETVEDLVDKIAHDVERHRSENAAAAAAASSSFASHAEPKFDCYAEVEKINDVLTVNQRTFRDNFCLWLYLRNDGPTSEFAVRAWQIFGVPSEWGNYAIRQTAWEGTTSTRAEIDGFGGERRVKLANVARDPCAFWFYTTRRGTEEYAEQYLISQLSPPRDVVIINFDLELVNMGTGEKLFKKGVIGVYSGPLTPSFTLTPSPSRSR